MDTPHHAPARAPMTAPGRRAAPPGATANKPVRWGRLGLAALLGVVAGTILFPAPAEGREDRPRRR